MLLLSTAMFAQSRATLLLETFDSDEMPAGWTITGLGTGNWSIEKTNKAGGSPNELMMYWMPQFDGISRVVSTPVNLTGIESAVFSIKHYFDNYGGTSTIGIATSSDNGATWYSAWEQEYSATGSYEVRENFTTPDMGKTNVLFCIYFNGNSYNINNWYFDNFEVFTQEDLDIKLISVDVPSIINAGELEVNFTVQNMGLTTIESFTVETVNIVDENSGTLAPETFETNLAPFEQAQFTLGTTFNLTPGTYTLPISISEVNGTSDDDMTNNSLTNVFNVAMGTTQKIPMIEHFSSSTCGPCVSVNYTMSQLTANNPGKFTYTKYPMYWPSPGDPYYTEEGSVRQVYYGCSGVPQTFLDGADQGFQAILQTNLDAQYNTPAFADVRGAFTLENNTIYITADFMSYVNLTDIRAYVTINETTTTGNVGSNGETEFHHIMMKMMEDAEGNTISINAGEYQRFKFTYDMSSTHVEDINDLEVALWLQNYETKEVLNSRFAYAYSEHCYPVQNHQMTENGNDLLVTWEAPEVGTPTGYMVKVNGEVVEESTSELSYTITNATGLNIAEVIALYEGDKSSVATASSNVGSGNDTTPCPAPTNLNATIEGEDAGCTVTLTWDAVAGVEEYLVDLDGEVTTVYENSHVVEFETEGNHSFKVASVCENGQSDYSEPYDFYVTFTSIEELSNNFVIYPNPAKDFVKLSAINGKVSTVKVYNYLGILVEEIEANANEVEISTSNYSAGIYFINIQTENGNVTKKVVVE